MLGLYMIMSFKSPLLFFVQNYRNAVIFCFVGLASTIASAIVGYWWVKNLKNNIATISLSTYLSISRSSYWNVISGSLFFFFFLSFFFLPFWEKNAGIWKNKMAWYSTKSATCIPCCLWRPDSWCLCSCASCLLSCWRCPLFRWGSQVHMQSVC